MFYLYRRAKVGKTATRYEIDKKEKRISLFGCKSGFIPWLLAFKIPPNQNEPYGWHVDVLSELDAQPEYRSGSLIIDLKPRKHETNVSLYEVLDVWGWSQSDSTKLLLRLNGLFVDEDPKKFNRDDFVREDADIDGPIYEFLHVDGSIKNGKLNGSWRFSRGGPANAVLLRPEPLHYFFRSIRERTPDVLNWPDYEHATVIPAVAAGVQTVKGSPLPPHAVSAHEV